MPTVTTETATTSRAPLESRVVATPLGEMTLVASPDGVRAILWPHDDPDRVPSAAPTDAPASPSAQRHLDAAAAWLTAYFRDDDASSADIVLDLVGTDFQRSVWQALTEIPSGATTTYGELATSLGRPTAARAIGAAVGRNPVSIVLPCHRVVGASGKLTGFAGGLDAKRWLLRHEGAALV